MSDLLTINQQCLFLRKARLLELVFPPLHIGVPKAMRTVTIAKRSLRGV
jgi:hypothetical protein